MDLKELENGVNPETHWYYQSKKLPLFEYFQKITKGRDEKVTLVDVGAGSGFFSLALFKEYSSQIKEVILVDINYTDDEIIPSLNSTVKKQRYLPETMENCLVIMMDVLEHLEDDFAMLNNIRANAGEHSYFFITVPAFNDLWSGHDDYLGHYRRYTIPTLEAVLKRADYTIRNSYYLYALIFLPVWLIRKIKGKKDSSKSDMAPAPAFVNSLLLAALSVEAVLCRANKFFGVTCAAEGRIK